MKATGLTLMGFVDVFLAAIIARWGWELGGHLYWMVF